MSVAEAVNGPPSTEHRGQAMRRSRIASRTAPRVMRFHNGDDTAWTLEFRDRLPKTIPAPEEG